MFRARFVCLLLSACCLLGLCGSAMAAEVDCDTIYCFTSQDFSQSEDPLLGICITELPQAHTGTVLLGTRVLRMIHRHRVILDTNATIPTAALIMPL